MVLCAPGETVPMPTRKPGLARHPAFPAQGCSDPDWHLSLSCLFTVFWCRPTNCNDKIIIFQKVKTLGEDSGLPSRGLSIQLPLEGLTWLPKQQLGNSITLCWAYLLSKTQCACGAGGQMNNLGVTSSFREGHCVFILILLGFYFRCWHLLVLPPNYFKPVAAYLRTHYMSPTNALEIRDLLDDFIWVVVVVVI